MSKRLLLNSHFKPQVVTDNKTWVLERMRFLHGGF